MYAKPSENQPTSNFSTSDISHSLPSPRAPHDGAVVQVMEQVVEVPVHKLVNKLVEVPFTNTGLEVPGSPQRS